MTWLLETDRPHRVCDMGWGRGALEGRARRAALHAFAGSGPMPDPATLPAGLRVEGPVPDLFVTRSGLLVASRAACAAIEAQGADVRTWPLILFDRWGEATGHAGLIVRARATAIREAGSACHVDPAAPGLARAVTLQARGPVRVDPVGAGSAPPGPLWWDHGLSRPYLLASDALAKALAPLDTLPMRRCGP